MLRSLSSVFFNLIAVVFLVVSLGYLWSGSAGIQFTRVAMENDGVAAKKAAERQSMAATTPPVPETEAMPEVEPPPLPVEADGPPVVLWLSIPGFRTDYIDKAESKFFQEIAEIGDSSTRFRPHFPSTSFASHATIATGATPDQHGIIADRIRTSSGEVVDSPLDSTLLQSEPIWATATRQGIRTLVHDWPLSQNQTGEHAAAHFLTDYDPTLSDEARLTRAMEVWRSDSKENPNNGLKLIMLRLNDVLNAGLDKGPLSGDAHGAVRFTSKLVKKFVDDALAEWTTLAPRSEKLIVLITTTHGLAEVEKNVNLPLLLGGNMMNHLDVVAHDAVANLFFKSLPASEGEAKLIKDKIDADLKKRIYFRTFAKEDLPAEWNYQHERTGDRVLVLKTGYSFFDETGGKSLVDPASGAKLFGGFGYPVEDSRRMTGQVLIGSFREPTSYTFPDDYSPLAFHATVCRLLDIKPAAGALSKDLDL